MKNILSITLALASLTFARADDITLTDGTVYKNAKIISHTAITATILDDDGGATVPISKMQPTLQKQLGYSPEAAAAFTQKQEEVKALENLKDALMKTALAAKGSIIQVLPEGILAELWAHDATDKGSPNPSNSEGFDYQSHQYLGERVFVECSTSGLIDNAPWSGTIWKMGTYSYTTAGGAMATIPKYTTDVATVLKAAGQ